MIEIERDPALTHIASLVRVRAASGALFFDELGRLLVVHPTYKDGWEVPGGSVEVDESPLAACVREIEEELGFVPRVGALLGVDWVPAAPPWDGGLMFLFDGGVLSAAQIAAIRLRASELDRFEFVPVDELARWLVPRMARRVRACVSARDHGAVYLEDGRSTS